MAGGTFMKNIKRIEELRKELQDQQDLNLELKIDLQEKEAQKKELIDRYTLLLQVHYLMDK